MKKLLAFAFALVMLGIGFASCDDDAGRIRVYIENNTSDTLQLCIQGGGLYSETFTDFNTVFPPKATTEMPLYVPNTEMPSYPFDNDRVKVEFRTKSGKIVNKNYHDVANFSVVKGSDAGYYFKVEESDIAN